MTRSRNGGSSSEILVWPFARDLQNGMSCQDLPSRALRANAAEHMAQSHSDILDTAPTQSRLKIVIDIQVLIRL